MEVKYSTIRGQTIKFPYKFSPLLLHVNESMSKILNSDEGKAKLAELEVHNRAFVHWLESHPDYDPTRLFDDAVQSEG